MNLEEYNQRYERYLNTFLDYSEKVFQSVATESRLAEAMKYAFFVGGKRIRPVAMLAFNDCLGGREEDVLPFAFALECLHSYSLVHDDLPALDNDFLRRGKPSCHAKFGEATAILAGDALLNFAFEHVLSKITDEKGIKALSYLARCSGYLGMLAGQTSDMEAEGKKAERKEDDEQTLLSIYENKTGKFLTAPFKIAAMITDRTKISAAEKIGALFGRAFQFADDLKDETTSEKIGKSVGKDKAAGKLTSVSVYGADKTREIIKSLAKEIEKILSSIDDSEFLSFMVKFVLK